MKRVPAPRYQTPPVEPFSKEEIEKLLKVCDFCDEAETDKRRKFTMRRATSYRDRAIILTLLDSGVRASELCSLKIGDLDISTGRVTIKPGPSGGAKGKKGRTVFVGKSTRRAIWRYLASREDDDDSDAPLFLGKHGRPIAHDALRQVIHALGEKAGIRKAYPHRFRHTFSITYLRSGGDLFTLQALLGHNSLEMVQIYARIAEIDIEQAHRRASPADNWRL
jgi:integrase/recombinase XerD